MQGWHAKTYANKIGMMHESPHPYIFFTLQLDSILESWTCSHPCSY